VLFWQTLQPASNSQVAQNRHHHEWQINGGPRLRSDGKAHRRVTMHDHRGRTTTMKRLLNAALALSLLSGTAACAEPFDHRGSQHERSDFDRGRGGWDGDHGRYRYHDDGAGTAIAVGVGLLALTAILASQDRDREVRYDRRDGQDYRNNVPPPPPEEVPGTPPPPPPYQEGPAD
jgi:hypothetical protein